jgi:hypothetical protein
MLQKGCDCREGEVEEWKQNWDEVCLDEVRRKRGDRERERREERKRERERESKMS